MAFAPTIHSIGDATFLAQVLNAVAMIMGTNDFVRLVSIGLLLGVLVIVLQGLFRGAREIAWQQLLLGWIIYACMFVPTTTVIIEDSYTGKARPVDNVPIGVAFAGSMISNIGYGITVLFETAYSDVASSTERPFVEPLMIVNALRAHASDEEVINRLNHAVGAGTDMGKTLENYIKECSMPKLALRVTTPNEMITGNAIEQLEFNSNIYGTRIFLNNAAGENLTCKDAWTKIKVALEKSKDPTVISAISSAANIKGEAGFANIDDYGSAFEALNIDSTQIEQFILTSVIKPIYEKAAMGYFKSVGDRTSAVMFNQAVMQRNTQWATEASMFMTVVRPFLSFFEGFMFAITPVLAFLLVLGGMGISLGMKYVMLILWIQLWMPVLSIINLYIIMSARGALATETFTSFYSIDSCALQIEHWIATGGMLAAATPLISLFLITGSTFAFTSLTQRMAGGDHINEKLHSPDVMTKGAFYAHDSAGNGNSVLGAIRTGTENTLPRINFDNMQQHALSSANSEAKTAINTLNDSYSTSYTDEASRSDQANISRTLGQRMQASQNKAVQQLEQGVRQTSWGKTLSDTQMAQVVDTVSMGVSAGLQTPDILKMIGASVGFKTEAKTSDQEASSHQSALSESDVRSLSNTIQKTDAAELTKAREAALTQTDSKAFLAKAGVSDNSQVGKIAANAVQKSRNFTETASAIKSNSFSGSVDVREMRGMLNNNEGNAKLGQLYNAYQGTAIGRQADAIATNMQKFNGVSADVARAAGLISALGMSSNHQDQQNLVGLLNTATGQNLSTLPNAEANRGVAGNVRNANVDKLGSQVATEVLAQKGQMDAVENIQLTGEKFSETEGQIDKAEEVVKDAHRQYVAEGPNEAYQEQNAKLLTSDITKAREGLKTEPVAPAALDRQHIGSQKEAVQKCVEAGLTDGQTMYMSRKMVGAYGGMQNVGYQALLAENQRLYGKEGGGSMTKEEVVSLTNDMVKHLDSAASGGGFTFQAGANRVVEWNRANTALGENPNQNATQRMDSINKQLNLGPLKTLTPEEQSSHNRQRGMVHSNNDK